MKSIDIKIEVKIPVSSAELRKMKDVEINALIDDNFKTNHPYYHGIGYKRTGYSVKYHINQDTPFDGIVLENIIISKKATLTAVFTL